MAKAVTDERLGSCPHCGASNSYLNSKCQQCGKPLPWGVAVARREPARSTAATAPAPEPLFMPVSAILLLSAGFPPFGIALIFYFFHRRRALGWACGLAALAGFVFAFFMIPKWFPEFGR